MVQIYRYDVIGNLPYSVREWIAGGNLQEHLNQHPLSAIDAAKMLRDLASAVSQTHAIGIIHRDPKPANVLLTPPIDKDKKPLPKLANFGQARPDQSDQGLTEAGVLAGTPK